MHSGGTASTEIELEPGEFTLKTNYEGPDDGLALYLGWVSENSDGELGPLWHRGPGLVPLLAGGQVTLVYGTAPKILELHKE
jgi:hypothetical protein